MEKRVKLIPGGWRDLKMIGKVMLKLCFNLVKTLPPEKRDSMLRTIKGMTYKCFYNRFSPLPPEYAPIMLSDLDAIARAAHKWECTVCDKNCNSCELGKAFDRVMMQSRGRNESWSYIRLDQEHYEDGLVVFDEKE